MNVSSMRAWIGLACLAAIQPFLILQLRSQDTAWVASPERREIQVSPRVARALSFGHLATLVDWLWIRAALDPAIHHVVAGEHPPAFYDLDLASRLDPAFFELYSAGASMLVVIRDDDEGSHTLLERGEAFRRNELPRANEILRDRFWADSWRIPMLLGYVHLFELGDLRSAAAAFTEASRIEGSPEFLSRLADRFAAPGGLFEVGIRLLTPMIESERDPRAKEALIEKRKSLYLAQYLGEIERLFRDFLAREPAYRANHKVSASEMSSYWERFKRASKISTLDPWGGQVSIDASGRVKSSTPRIKVFGLE